MIFTYAITQDNQLIIDVKLEDLRSDRFKFYWVDFEEPTNVETKLLSEFFHFHPLAIEDCLHFIQRPNMNYYDGVLFFVLHSLSKTIRCEEIDVFVGENYVVSFHKEKDEAIDMVKQKLFASKEMEKVGPLFVLHSIIDELVDCYFPILHQIEDKLNEYEEKEASSKKIIEEVYEIRRELIRLRKTIIPMRDLLYRMINSKRIQETKQIHHYFSDIYDHLMKLTDIVASNQDVTSDMRENYMSIQSNRMNSIMMTLTVITTIFMPLTFIVGVYGMNFDHMPELHWQYGYFITLGVMAIIVIVMIFWFYKKGWLFKK
ncbi:magnesium/cobalt transporter CorA [Bacillus sp. ISL-40]|uniref:magnesium/cobalt transporter CorA n=1 Tax=unclassified Bacillus (in: firmicutes) TaxID=185979 RepID=UPI001BE94732|nr:MULTISPECIES: magnesium/cobalt transporter CorA [unclassified Bacillus (in: firmicutes)]MBT2696010.1 magnesium/cobalt transporter CorA [Bacillus sp. ISL-40]MBT2719545.1 magnesium/cobalt transporter CorA [Bacillus sp. ISL-46]MBT2743900.1 magnesium/cobalt transporter CorA [Bacillus sp. ISL-77]